MAPGQLCHLAMAVFIISLAYSTSYAETSIVSQSPQPSTSQSTPKTESYEDDILNEVINAVQELVNEDNSTEDISNSSTSVEDYSDLENCTLPANLDRYCIDIPKEVLEYFHNDMSVTSLLTSLLKNDVKDALRSMCLPGSWCLPASYHKDILNGKAQFYGTSPLCSDDLWECLEGMYDDRFDCGEKNLSYLVDAVELMCNLEEKEMGKANPLDPECYAKTLEALYVFFNHLTNTGSEPKAEQEDCDGYKAQMVKTYLRASDACNVYKRPLLERFEPWKDIIENTHVLAITCNINHNVNNNTDNRNTTDDGSKELEEIVEELVKEAEDVIEAEEVNHEAESDNRNTAFAALSGTNKALLFGAITFGTIMTIGLVVLAVFAVRRFRGRCPHDKWEYTKVLDEEAKLLRSEYT